MTTVHLDEPYEVIIERIVRLGYAKNKTEVVRKALVAYDRQLGAEEEDRLVGKMVEEMMADIKSGKAKTYTLDEVRKELGLKFKRTKKTRPGLKTVRRAKT